ncbi:MAG TPA: DUF1003 domain-containing protein [Acidimicrobiales bacterium]|nr:DUF1003 domain-containing protein [Acidimicrobiales bacterium]
MKLFPTPNRARRGDVTVPRGAIVRLGPHYSPDTFGRLSEAVARYFGTARFLAIQTVVVAIWITLNSVGLIYHWDPYPFILLNLMFSTQAAYAAPLILLAQNRQDERDRENIERDRAVAARTQADTEFVARELASVRLALAGMATAEDLGEAVNRLEGMLKQLAAASGSNSAAPPMPSRHVGPTSNARDDDDPEQPPG